MIDLFKKNKIQFEDNELYGSRQDIKMLLGKYLYLNGLLDEDRCQNSRNLTEQSTEQDFASSRRPDRVPCASVCERDGRTYQRTGQCYTVCN